MKSILKIAAIAAVAFSLAACDQIYVYPDDLEPGVEKCETNGGVEKFYLEGWGSSSKDLSYVNTHCKNGVEYNYEVEDRK